MAEHTEIQWADSTINGMMGCDGCELSSNGGSGTCYAETLTNFRKGNPGWPKDFLKPQIFPGRLEKACRWSDLTGEDRADKPWLNGMPRHIFLDDLGDTFTESLPLGWIEPHIPAMAASPHVWLFLTKRPDRMCAFFKAYGAVPANFLLGTSCIAGAARLCGLERIQERFSDARVWVSAEPLWRDIDFTSWLPMISWLVIGGESGPRAKAFDLSWACSNIDRCAKAGTPLFIKQLGSLPFADGCRIDFRDRKGGDWTEWPERLRVRQMPKDKGEG